MLYEDVGLLTPFRTATNRRRYSQRDVRRLQVIQHLTRERDVNLAGVRHLLSIFDLMKKNQIMAPEPLRDAYERYADV